MRLTDRCDPKGFPRRSRISPGCRARAYRENGVSEWKLAKSASSSTAKSIVFRPSSKVSPGAPKINGVLTTDAGLFRPLDIAPDHLERGRLPQRIECLLHAAVRPKQDRPAAGVFHGLQQRLVHLIHAGRGKPREIELAALYLPADLHGPVVVGGKRVVDELDLPIALGKAQLNLLQDILYAAKPDPAASVLALFVRLKTEDAASVAAPAT